MSNQEPQLRKEVERLGRFTPEGLAAELQDVGIRGDRRRAESCPLTYYLRRRTHNHHLAVTEHYIRPYGVFSVPAIGLPDNARDFVERFDRGEFPELERARIKRVYARELKEGDEVVGGEYTGIVHRALYAHDNRIATRGQVTVVILFKNVEQPVAVNPNVIFTVKQ